MPTVVITQPLLEFLWERRIFHHLQTERWRIGEQLFVPDDCALEPFSHLLVGHVLPRTLGSFSYSSTAFEPATRVGRYCSLAAGIKWMGSDHPTDWASTSPVFFEHNWLGIAAFRKIHGLTEEPLPFPIPPRGVTIGHDVWIGDEAMIAPGVTIGDGAVVGARALVLKDVPPYAIVVGQPAKVTRMRMPENLVARFLDLQWWRFGPNVLQGLPADQPERFLDLLEARIAADRPAEFQPAPLRAQDIVALANPA
jgi:acetyltransferase-like isoleucine patch superfamily enzyme